MKKKKELARIQKFLEQMDWLFNLNNFDRSLVLKEKDEDDGDGKKSAEFEFIEEYCRCEVRLYPCFFEETPEDQRKLLLHELIHSITIPAKKALYDFSDGKFITPETIRQINEKMTSKIENIMDGLLRGRLKYATKAYHDYLKKL